MLPTIDPADRESTIPVSIYVAAVCLAVAIGVVTLLRHWYFLSTSYDMAFYSHAISQISMGDWTNTMFGFHVFADHWSPILIVLSPLAYLAPVEGLLVTQAIAVGSAIVPAYRLGEAVAGRRVGLLAAAWFGLSASVWHTVLFDFRPATLGAVAMMWLLSELEASRLYPRIIGLAAIAASSREDVAILAGLALIMFGLHSREKIVLLIGGATAAVGMWFSTVGSRLFAPFDYFMWYRYADYGRTPGEVLTNLDYAVPTAITRVFRDDPLVATAALVVPMLIVAPFLGWRYAWPGLVVVLSNAVSADPFIPTIYHQYYLLAVVFFIWGGVHAFRRPWLASRAPMAMAATVAAFLIVGPLGLALPGQDGRTVRTIVTQAERRAIAGIIAAIPEDVSISAGVHLLAHFSRNPDIKPFPAPLLCSGLLLTYYPRTTFPDFVVVEDRDVEGLGLQVSDLGYRRVRSGAGVTVWQATDSHPPSEACPSVEEARDGLFQRVEREAR